jgi:hypothetical protein
MIDPEKITNFNLNKNQLEEVLLFWVCAAGKNARTAARCLDKLLVWMREWIRDEMEHSVPRSPFALIRRKDSFHRNRPGANGKWLAALMQIHGIGCYNQKSKTFMQLANSGLDLKTCTVEDLEAIKGIGPKTARCFIMHSRPNQECAGLDTHILKYLRAKGYDAPKITPTGKRYRELEKIFMGLAKKAKKTIAEFDLEIWNEYSVK